MHGMLRRLLAIVCLVGVLGFAPAAIAQDKDPSGGGGPSRGAAEEGVYVSPTYGYRVSYDESWTVYEETSEGGYDSLTLEDEVSYLYVEGIVAYEGDSAVCIDSQIAGLGELAEVSDVEEVDRSDRSSGSRASYTFTVTTDDGAAQVGVVYDCRPIVEGVSVVVFTLLDFTGELAGEVDRFDAIVDSYEPGEAPANVGTSDPVAGGGDLQANIEAAAEQVDAYWTSVFEAFDLGAYEAPQYVFFDDQIVSGCGTVAPGEVGPFYCGADKTIYMDLPVMQQLADLGGPLAPAMIVAHEVGHHVQLLLGIQSSSITTSVNSYTSAEIELMADCMAGAWTGNLRNAGLLDAQQIEQTVVMIVTVLGDPISYDSLQDQAHGPGSLRTWWFLKGMYEGPVACFS